MNQAIYLDPKQVPSQLTSGYSGRKFKAVVCETVTIPSDAGLWDGGSREKYHVVRLADGAALPAAEHNAAPWDNGRRDRTVNLESGVCVVKHSVFCGKDMGLTFYVHPSDATAMLPAPAADMTETEKLVLQATRSFKSSYGGRDRYQMATDGLRYDGKPYPTRAQWDEAKAELVTRGYLNKAGAITTAGRNAS